MEPINSQGYEIIMTREDIVKKYPKIFVDEYIEAPVAWLPIIDELCDCMESYGYSQCSTNKGVIQFPQVVCDQVKSKFSQLRFYYHFEYDQEDIPDNISADHRKYVDGMIAYAETRIRRLTD